FLEKYPEKLDYVSICSPNYLHASHIKAAFRLGANAICEKPLVLTTAELEDLAVAEKKYDRKLYTVLQLRVHDAILDLKNKVEASGGKRHQIDLKYFTSRGNWYHESWKGDVKKSGGLSTNIGVHFFDMLTWIFGSAQDVRLTEKTATVEAGILKLERADVNWYLCIDREKLPQVAKESGKTTYRSLKIDGSEFEFSEGFTELHNRVYKDVLEGKGYGLEAAHAAIAIVEKLREMTPETSVR
ncbi:MAG: Gfo/Idh/MocA family oxidoreductase, partial [Bdellovibrionales bacterium]|nr:Gfo/Idh/MocA family oxidoreductase [Bdellovibrionales bacterium]